MVDASGTTTWTYDNLDRVFAKTTPQGTLTYTYLPNSFVASVNSSNANGYSVNYAYDVINRLTGVTDNRLGNMTTNTYDDANNVATISYPNGVVHTYTVDPKDQVTGVSIQHSAAMLASFNYTRRETGAIGAVFESTGRNVAYGYDNAWRLTNETISADPVPANNGALTYALDQVANRASLTSTLGALGNQGFSFDVNDRITTDASDANGNTLTSGGKSYTYDFLDRLVTASGGISFIYNGDGNRVARTTGGTTIRYLIDDQTPLGYTQVAEERVGGAVGRRYTYGLQRISQTQVGGATSYYFYDQAKTARGLANTDGATTDTFAFDAFGNLVSRTGSTPNEMLYRGEQFDVGLDSYYLRARYFTPRTGRFLTMDKYEGTSHQPKSLHGYVYGHADPVKHSDPSGFAVAIGYALTTHNYSTGAAIAGAHNAVMGTCLLSPAILIIQVLATHGFASLASHPIVSACDPFTPTLPGGRMRPPGDCSPAQYTVLSTAVQALCHANGDFGQTPCFPRTDDKETCAGKATNIGACAAARIVREATCFRGGDFGHRRWIATMIGQLEGCWVAWEQAP